MPEGPEVRRAADRIQAALAEDPLIDVVCPSPHLEAVAARQQGATLRAVETRGKAFLLRFSTNDTLYVHLQLYGVWRFAPTRPAMRRSLRIGFLTLNSGAWLYSATDVHWLRGDEHPYLLDLGPDVLTASPDEVAARLLDPRWSRRALGSTLLDQAFFAGVGNYLRSEILFAAGLLPGRRPANLDEAERARLASAIMEVARRSYETGLTVEPRVAAAGRRSGLPRGAWRHHVFGRAGRPCPRCGSAVRYTEVAGRRLYLCGTCQR